jgi:four helix bundle protein
MGAKTFQELVAWQLAAELRDQVIAAIEKPPLCHHRRLCDQLERAVEHAPGDIAEGFGRYYPREFARYLAIARSELMEAQNHLDAAARRGAMAPDVFERCWTLSRRALGATTRLMQAVLQRSDAPRGTAARGRQGGRVKSPHTDPAK